MGYAWQCGASQGRLLSHLYQYYSIASSVSCMRYESTTTKMYMYMYVLVLVFFLFKNTKAKNVWYNKIN